MGAYKDVQVGFGELPEANSAISFKIIQEWLRECDNLSDHSDCRLAKKGYYTSRESLPTMPTRVIDVGSTQNNKVRLYPTVAGSKGDWIALSHPWGDGPSFVTTRDNLEAHLAGIDFDEMPATFRDAVTVTRALGHRYLWIDSLCIIQGSGGDLDQEYKNMEDVYSGAYCVIAASRSTSHHSGFLKGRPNRQVVALRPSKAAPNSRLYISEMTDNFQAHVLDGALNRRAWVMQEHALARRTIFFAEHQIYWECGRGVRCETMISMTK